MAMIKFALARKSRKRARTVRCGEWMGRNEVELTARELEVVCLLVDGLSSKEIARQLRIAPRTIERHIDRARLKTKTRNRAQLVEQLMRDGLITWAPDMR